MELKQAKELVRGRLSDKRYEHTINVKKMAVKLAKQYGVDEDKAALAALLERLEHVASSDFGRVSYTEAVDLLKKSGEKFDYPVEWGIDLQTEHERYLTEHIFKRPVFVTDYPKDIKAFYMKQNDDGKTVRAMDVLFPGIGEIIGGSEREADYGKLHARVQELGMNEKELWWYLDPRRWGSAPHSGFGLGFDRLLLFVTGMTNIRDVQPFPRTPKNAEF